MYERFGKRLLDLAAALLLLVLLAPLFLAVALAVWAWLGRPLLFVQPRAGRGGMPFTLLKFRSMAPGRAPDAARLGRFGRALRASGLDELPQLINVLRGEMSLVGPRPLPLAYLAHYSPRQALRLRVRPGLVGPGVAAGRNAVAWPQRLELGADYAARPPRLSLDLMLAWRSLWVLLRGQGVTAPGHATMPSFTPPGPRDPFA
ncbi:sugar transferase [Falsiroseomonas selenitidurans]|uniref:Sugar transferase n=1 Tax=Falsiroseomonas selenitidurans TaxID=2716335 RepID=A0ABX1E5B8_9PROT|nr:sugar transferase [Falsiroseomonas selenitidurans]NKC32379.1 sugar transferase [Falsiroseomonas selenitidurans]